MKTIDVGPRYFKIFKQFNNISLSNITQISSRPTRIPFEIIKKLSLEKFRFSFRLRDIILLYPFNNRAIPDIFEGGVMRVNFTQVLKVSTTSTLFTCCCKQSPRVYIFPGKRFERKGGLDNSRGRIVGIYQRLPISIMTRISFPDGLSRDFKSSTQQSDYITKDQFTRLIYACRLIIELISAIRC